MAPQPAGARTGEAHLLARWEIVRPSDGAIVLARDLVACLARLTPMVAVDSAAEGVSTTTAIECGGP